MGRIVRSGVAMFGILLLGLGMLAAVGAALLLVLMIGSTTVTWSDVWGLASKAIGMLVVGALCLAATPDPEGSVPAGPEQAGQTLEELGLGIDGRTTTPERALIAGMIQASLVQSLERLRRGQAEEALKAADGLLDVLPRLHPDDRVAEHHAAVHYVRAAALEASGKPEEALAGYRQALERVPGHTLATRAIARLAAPA